MNNALRRLSVVAAAAAMAGIATVALSQEPPKPTAEQAIKYRQSVYKVILWNFGPMAAAMQDKADYDAQRFERQAARVAIMAPMLLEGYPHGSHTGATTRAKPEIWQNHAEFQQLMTAMVEKASALAEVAKEGNEDKSKAAFGELGGACRACHDKYRND